MIFPDAWHRIIDHFHNDPKTLEKCSLVSGSWAYHAQKHLFNEIKFQGQSQLLLWEKDFPDPLKSPARHTKLLCLIFSQATGITEAHIGVIKSFTNVTHLKVWVGDSRYYEPGSLDVLHNLLPAVGALRVHFNFRVHLSHLFALIGLSPSIKDLDIYGRKIYNNRDDFKLPSTLPAFTGTLAIGCDLDGIMGPLLRLPPNSLRFRKIVWRFRSSYDESSVRHMTDLIERCSDTLEYIDFDLAMLGGSRPFGFFDGFSI